jgi:hypothetical protein
MGGFISGMISASMFGVLSRKNRNAEQAILAEIP